MIKVWNRRDQWHQIESVEAFCLTICRNLSIDRQRHNDNPMWSNMPPATDPEDLSYASNPEQIAIGHDRIRMVHQLIAQLPEKQRTAMELRDIEGKSYKDIATIMDITEEQVKVNIFRGRKTVRERFLMLTTEKK